MTQDQGRPAEEAERTLCRLRDGARFHHPGVDLFVFLTPHAPTQIIATCGSSAELREAAVCHLCSVLSGLPGQSLAGRLQQRFELTPEPAFAVWLLEEPSADDEEPAGAA